MFSKGTKIYSMITSKCPKCHEGDMYKNNNPYVMTEIMNMHDNCKNCGFKFKIEPNFFFGAMFVSYALSVLSGISIFLMSFYVFESGVLISFYAISIGLCILLPIIIRLSRNIYINIFVNYNAEAGKKKLNN